MGPLHKMSFSVQHNPAQEYGVQNDHCISPGGAGGEAASTQESPPHTNQQ